ncbi:MAG: hypothetical protein KAT05_12875 [Spirochaetes bacterium]|nr:hypothetical protein [Spirochaetota bacterium]
MSKIVLAVNSMISNADKISDVSMNIENMEYFFKYDNKYVWGIILYENNYTLYFYPKIKDTRELDNMYEWDKVDFITYKTEELKTREAIESFSELYLIIKEKHLNVDSVLNDIIGDLE